MPVMMHAGLNPDQTFRGALSLTVDPQTTRNKQLTPVLPPITRMYNMVKLNVLRSTEFRSCVKVEVAVLGSPS